MAKPFVPHVLVCRPGVEGQDRSARALLAHLRLSGFEASHIGRSALADIAAAAVDESADVLLVTLHTGDHLHRCEQLREELRKRGAPDLPLVVQGTLPAGDHPLLAESGVRRIFGPAEPPEEVARFLGWLLEPKAFIARASVEAADTL